MRKKKYEAPQPYAEETKDQRFAGTFEVLVPVEGRVRPLRAAGQFETLEKALAWMHSPEGKDVIRDIVEKSAA